MGRIFVIGDIHGCLHKLLTLLERIPAKWDNDKLIFLGDYIDRGQDSKGVIDCLVGLSKKYPDNLEFLMGNHERMFLDFLTNPDNQYALYLSFGGQATIQSYGLSPSVQGQGLDILPAQHANFFNNLKMFSENEEFFFVHAGVKPGVPLSEQKDDDMLWIRHEFINSDYDWGKRIVFGHTPFDAPYLKKNMIGIDTGAVYGGRLCCLVIPEIEFIFA